METRRRNQSRRKPRAATREVVGSGERPVPIRPEWRNYYDRLLDLLDYLLPQRQDLTDDAIEEQTRTGTHTADVATDSYDRDLALGMLSSEQDAVYEIEAALDRIRNGRYGICELRGKPIERARLEAIPWTRFSAAAERQLEKSGAFKHARLGPRVTMTRGQMRGDPDEAE